MPAHRSREKSSGKPEQVRARSPAHRDHGVVATDSPAGRRELERVVDLLPGSVRGIASSHHHPYRSEARPTDRRSNPCGPGPREGCASCLRSCTSRSHGHNPDFVPSQTTLTCAYPAIIEKRPGDPSPEPPKRAKPAIREKYNTVSIRS